MSQRFLLAFCKDKHAQCRWQQHSKHWARKACWRNTVLQQSRKKLYLPNHSIHLFTTNYGRTCEFLARQSISFLPDSFSNHQTEMNRIWPLKYLSRFTNLEYDRLVRFYLFTFLPVHIHAQKHIAADSYAVLIRLVRLYLSLSSAGATHTSHLNINFQIIYSARFGRFPTARVAMNLVVLHTVSGIWLYTSNTAIDRTPARVGLVFNILELVHSAQGKRVQGLVCFSSNVFVSECTLRHLYRAIRSKI